MKILFLYPKFPKTFWGFKYALPFIGKKATLPPLGILTVAALLPKEWEKRLVDLNIQNLKNKDIAWADFVFISAMVIQKESVKEVVSLAKSLGKKIVAGGPLFTTGYEEFVKDIDCFVLGEMESVLPEFLEDIKNGSLKKTYKSNEWPDIGKTPIPAWELINMKKYATMGVQFSRGCPFNCEFCDIVLLNGRVPRIKSGEQIIRELEAIYDKGWRGGIFFVDDNFIGNKKKLKEEVLPAMIEWMEKKRYPFSFNTQASINLADDKELMDLMVKAGFSTVFVGIESPKEESLKECGKMQNVNRNLLESIKTLQLCGLQVQAGFIVGFDQDNLSIFEKMTSFIQNSGIATAMVGLLQAPTKTRLWERLKKEGRLITEATGSNTDCTINFVPKMNLDSLVSGYKKLITKIYSPKYYYQRLQVFLRQYKPRRKKAFRMDFNQLSAFLKSVFILGIKEKERVYYWKLLFWCLFRKPKFFPIAIEMIIKGFHLRKISENYTLR
ncbi:MAG: B12-binding domain-containing radical SAM protein [bacterium]|nr:B12-binding domain-containing radical SAM protein [bacterium]